MFFFLYLLVEIKSMNFSLSVNYHEAKDQASSTVVSFVKYNSKTPPLSLPVVDSFA